jgi:hypothetical protein
MEAIKMILMEVAVRLNPHVAALIDRGGVAAPVAKLRRAGVGVAGHFPSFGQRPVASQAVSGPVFRRRDHSRLAQRILNCYNSIMKQDPEYLKQLLTAFRDAQNPTTDIRELDSKGLSIHDPRFEFHMMLLQDDGLLESASRKGGIGLAKSADGAILWSVIPLRLTPSGQKFAKDLLR